MILHQHVDTVGLFQNGWLNRRYYMISYIQYIKTKLEKYGDDTIDFNDIVENRCSQIKAVLQKKAGEYARESNRFHNFDKAAVRLQTTPEKALRGMMEKHAVSVDDMIENPENVTIEIINEKIGDNINYLILLEGLLIRRICDKK